MIPETTDIYINIAKIQAKRRDNWIAGYAADKDMEKAHQAELALLREKLSRTQEEPIEEIHVPEERFILINFITYLFKTLTQSFTRKAS